MPELKRGDGVEIHWEERGEGPVVFFAHAGWASMPSTYSDLLTDLATDHRVVTWDPRGIGQSTRGGPYDIGTDAGDMAALVDEVGGPGGGGLGGRQRICLRVAAERPQLVEAVVLASSVVELQFHQREMDSIAASESVLEAALKQLSVDPRPVLRTMISITNPQLSDAEAGERVAAQVAYCPPDAAQERAEAIFVSDDLTRIGPALGDRLWIIYFENPLSPRELLRRARDLLPEAHIVDAEDGPISRPDITAGVVRKITAPLRAQWRIALSGPGRRLGLDPGKPTLRLLELGQRRQRLWCAPEAVQSLDPRLANHRVAERLAEPVLAKLELQPQDSHDHLGQPSAARPAEPRGARGGAHSRDRLGPRRRP